MYISVHSLYTRVYISVHSLYTRVYISVYSLYTRVYISVHSLYNRVYISVHSLYTCMYISVHSLLYQCVRPCPYSFYNHFTQSSVCQLSVTLNLPLTFELHMPSPVQLHQLQVQLPLLADVLDGGHSRLQRHLASGLFCCCCCCWWW